MDHIITRKKLIYRARYRSSREADLIFKAFIEKTIEFLTDDEQKIFSELMQIDDLTLFQWIEEKLACPHAHYTPVLKRIQRFIKEMKVT